MSPFRPSPSPPCLGAAGLVGAHLIRAHRGRGRIPRLAPALASRREEGFTLIEVLVAMLILTVGIMGLIGAFDSARKLTLLSERRTSVAHRAQLEAERAQALPYAQLAMTKYPTREEPAPTEEAKKFRAEHPNYYVQAGNTTYQWGQSNEQVSSSENTSELIAENTGAFTTTPLSSAPACPRDPDEARMDPCTWTDGRLSGYTYDFLTWVKVKTESECGGCAEPSHAYKRLTVVVTVNVPGSSRAVAPTVVSTLIPNPNAAPKNATAVDPVENPATTCGGEPCISSIDSGKAHTFFLHDSPASLAAETLKEALKAPAESTVHATVAPTSTIECTASKTSATACPKPDVMNEQSPSVATKLNYSTNLGTIQSPEEYASGRVLSPDVECSATPTSTDNSKGELWVSEKLAAEATLTGAGGLSIYTQTLNGVEAKVKLCVAVYQVPENIENLVKAASTGALKEFGYAEYEPSAWPTAMSQQTFDFKLKGFTTGTLKAGERIGFRVWTSSTMKIAIAYDNFEEYPSSVQLNTTQ